MKKIFYTLLSIFISVASIAQTPQALNYQAVARNNGGSLMANQSITVRFTIHQGGPNGTTVYQETHSTTTNGYGLFTLPMGLGTPLNGVFANINWSSFAFFVQVEVNAGAGFIDMGSTQFLSVPYALNAKYSERASMGMDDLTDVNTPAPTNGQYLQWNGSAWVAVTPAAASNYFTANGNDIYNNNVGNVGIGSATTPAGKLHVFSDGSLTGGARISATVANTVGAALFFDGANQDWVLYGTNANGAPGADRFAIRDQTAGVDRLVFDNAGRIGIGMSNPSVAMQMSSTSVQTVNIAGYPYSINPGVYIKKEVQTNSADNIGVVGEARNFSNSYWSIGGLFSGTGTSSNNYGVYGQAKSVNTGTNYAVYGAAANGATNYAGYFAGNVTVTGTLSKGGGTFKIDHPLDPANKYLYHSFVESPDMMNIYNGNITTDANGDATVLLPDYFEALNMEFRYQLTCMGQFAQAMVLEKIQGNQFKIKTDKANVEVSWQVTGVRQDPWAKANRVVPEVEKAEKDKGYYIYPELYNQDQRLSLDPSNKRD